MPYSTTENEVIGLCISLEAIDSIVNRALLLEQEVQAFPGEAAVIFHSSIHKELFLIRLLDIVKESGSSKLTGVDGSCLKVLKSATNTASFDQNGSVTELATSVAELEGWLDQKRPLKMWLPTLNIDATLDIPRLELITISGNNSKHNLSRLTGIATVVANRLRECGYEVSEKLIPLALDDFREHLSDNYFIYYSTWLAELLNNIRWGIHTYLLPTFKNCYKAEPDGFYSYEYPSSIKNEIPRQWFWRLMNHIRREPCLKRFKGAHSLKEESSLEWQ